MICIDTEALRDAVEAARSASENISYAVEKLQSVTTHDDWVCSNRDKINEYILTNAQVIKQLQENEASFLNNLKFVSERFDETENSLVGKTASVDDAIGAVVAIPINATVVSPVYTASGLASDMEGLNGRVTDYSLWNSSVVFGNSALGTVSAKHLDSADRITSFKSVFVKDK